MPYGRNGKECQVAFVFDPLLTTGGLSRVVEFNKHTKPRQIWFIIKLMQLITSVSVVSQVMSPCAVTVAWVLVGSCWPYCSS